MEVLSKQSSIRSFFKPRTAIPTTPEQQQPQLSEEKEKEPSETLQEDARFHKDLDLPRAVISSSRLQDPDPPRAVVSHIRPQHIQPLKRINTLLLPITYPDNFYNKILSPEVNTLSYVILWNSPRPSDSSKSRVYTLHKEQQVIGGIVCKLEQSLALDNSSVYIQSLALLSPYRSQGLAAALLDTVIRTIVQLPPSTNPAPTSLYAHVWTENTEALIWYKARGFIADPAPIQNYYNRLRPSTAFILRRPINLSDYLRHKSSIASTTTSKPSLEDWEMVESPNMTLKSVSAPPSLPFIESPPSTTSPESPQKSNKKQTTPAQTYLNFPSAPTPTEVSSNLASNIPNGSIPQGKPTDPARPSMTSHTESFQNRAPDQEWNDLPPDLLGMPNKTALSRTASTTTDTRVGMGASTPSSRSSSSSRTTGKKKRSYPAAAFGSAG